MSQRQQEFLRTFSSPAGSLVEAGAPGYFSDHATRLFSRVLRAPQGGRVAEAGCGTGILSVLALKLGALEAHATDLDPVAVQFARKTAELNEVSGLYCYEGNLLDPLPETLLLDLAFALLPHKPAHCPITPRFYGGWDGTDLLLAFLKGASLKVRSGGVIDLYLNSIANPMKVLTEFSRSCEVRPVAIRKRYFTVGEFEGYAPGLFLHMQKLREEGKCEFHQDRFGLYFWATIYRGKRI